MQVSHRTLPPRLKMPRQLLFKTHLLSITVEAQRLLLPSDDLTIEDDRPH